MLVATSTVLSPSLTMKATRSLFGPCWATKITTRAIGETILLGMIGQSANAVRRSRITAAVPRRRKRADNYAGKGGDHGHANERSETRPLPGIDCAISAAPNPF